MAQHRVLLSLLAAASIGLLTACGTTGDPYPAASPTPTSSASAAPTPGASTPTPVPTPPTAAVPLDVQNPESGDPDGFDQVQAWATPDILTVTSYGSSSCPNIPSITSVDDSARLVNIELVSDSEGPCTADLAPTTFNISVEQDFTGYTVRPTFRVN